MTITYLKLLRHTDQVFNPTYGPQLGQVSPFIIQHYRNLLLGPIPIPCYGMNTWDLFNICEKRKYSCICDACLHNVGKRHQAFKEPNAINSSETLGDYLKISEPTVETKNDSVETKKSVEAIKPRRVVKRRVVKVKKSETEEEKEVKKEDTNSESSEEEVFEVEKLLDVKSSGKVTKYLVKWKGFSNKHNTWEPETNVHSALQGKSRNPR